MTKQEIADMLKSGRISAGLEVKEVAERLISMGAIKSIKSFYNWESGRSQPDADTFMYLCDLYGIKDIIGAFGHDKEFKNDPRYAKTENEFKLIQKYRLLTPEGRKAANENIETLLNFQNNMQQSFTQATATNADNVINISSRQMPLYATPASAGLGQYIDNSDYELVNVGPECPAQANFLLKVQGDSMEPKLYDGDVLYVQQKPCIEDGEIGVFYLDGNVYVKKQEHKGNKCYLVSLNPAYAPIEVGEFSECVCYGKVLN